MRPSHLSAVLQDGFSLIQNHVGRRLGSVDRERVGAFVDFEKARIGARGWGCFPRSYAAFRGWRSTAAANESHYPLDRHIKRLLPCRGDISRERSFIAALEEQIPLLRELREGL